ncbi:MAG: serine dehydratase [Azospira oryzae]|nr:MAG: serine dehydratase [Azospira oryzae]PZP78680.1 MAG: serine dehydratase [Azospira oryzae]
MDRPPDLRAIREAHARIRPHVHRTPVLTCSALDRLAGARLFFKCENFQKVGAFKARGACNAVFSLADDEALNGVVTHSSGNHAAALSLAAARRRIPAYLVMPSNAPQVKRKAVAAYGGRIVLCEPTLAAREEACARIMAETGARLVHPYNDYRVMAGQGTAALELLEEVRELDVVVVPVGGGGLLSGTALAAKGLKPGVRVVGAEPAGADDAWRSFKSGELQPMPNPETVADGLRTALGTLTFPIIRSHVDDIVTTSEAAIIDAMRKTWELMKIVIEASSAVPLAAILEGRLALTGCRVGIILSGGNVDLDRLPWRP